MPDRGVHIRPEAVFLRLDFLPEGFRALVGQGDANQRLAGLEAIFPGLMQPQRPAILRWQRLAIGTNGQEGEVIPRLLQRAAFDIGPGVPGLTKARHHRGECRRLEAEEAGPGLDTDRLQQGSERKAGPGYNHRPGLDATQPIDALLQWHAPQEIVDVEAARGIDQAIDLQHPGPLRQFLRASPDSLIGAELIIVVVGRGLALRGDLPPRRIGRVAWWRERALIGRHRRGGRGERQASGDGAKATQPRTSAQHQRLWRR